MKITLCFIFAALFMIIGAATVSNAQNKANAFNINARQQQQHKRITDGIKDGTLTPAEAEHLQKREALIRRAEARFRASGNRLTPMERRRLLFQLNTTSRLIYRFRHNQKTPTP